ncbi:hypothetical protein CAPTEDRAFT_210346 [Capitella teleta]|uniref:Uncharacterized protein n=1 Tax=Capitella teleta TaxID=283909 RepID=N1PB76_CAPTE|nr:hypothetical protein CAPTEDRAFT_210346 [Capitella teleta]|eukprot:ELU18871.1 hypothetical protein CAPTEDRAFT_210346 [Capitella teleta]
MDIYKVDSHPLSVVSGIHVNSCLYGQDVSRVRSCLFDFLDLYILHQTLMQAIDFTVDLIKDVLRSLYRGRRPPFPVRMDLSLKPVVCPAKQWRPLVLALGMTIEEPDRNIDVALCGLSVEDECSETLLKWTKSALDLMRGVDFYALREILTVPRDQGYSVLKLIGERSMTSEADVGQLSTRFPNLFREVHRDSSSASVLIKHLFSPIPIRTKESAM